MCDVALFWIPNKDPKVELGNRIYAETTKMELAENIARGKKIRYRDQRHPTDEVPRQKVWNKESAYINGRMS